MLLYSQVKNLHYTNHSSYGPICIDACMYHIDLSLKFNVLLITTLDTMIPYYTDTPPVVTPPVDVIIGATVGAIGVVLIIIITLVSIIVLMMRKRGKS